MGSDRNSENLYFKIHYLKYVCKITYLIIFIFVCLLINIIIIFKLVAGFLFGYAWLVTDNDDEFKFNDASTHWVICV